MRKEFSSKNHFLLAVLLQFIIAYSTALFINFIGVLYGFCKLFLLIFIAVVVLLTILLKFAINGKIIRKNQALLK
jgi:hypothetical protein